MIVVAACFRSETAWIKRRAGMQVVRIPMGSRSGVDRILGAAESPRLLVSTGFCGGLDLHLKTGDLLLATEIVHHGRTIRIDPALRARARAALIREGIKPTTGRVVTTARVIERREEKRRLSKETGAIGVEMEAGALADWADQRGIPFLALKGVLDPADKGLPVAHFRRAVLHPVAVLTTGRSALIAGRAIGRGIGAIIREFGGAE